MEDLKKSVLIKGDNIIGFTGRGVIPMTQEEFNALPPEKQLNGSYYITDGTDEIVISDNEVSEKQLWSSQKIATELKTNSNTDVTYVTLTNDGTFESMGNTYCKYQVKNGICYFQFFVSTTVATDIFTEIYNGLPKPTFSQYFSYSVYYNSQGLNKTLQVNISDDGLLTAANTLPNSSYMIVGSYPIA